MSFTKLYSASNSFAGFAVRRAVAGGAFNGFSSGIDLRCSKITSLIIFIAYHYCPVKIATLAGMVVGLQADVLV